MRKIALAVTLRACVVFLLIGIFGVEIYIHTPAHAATSPIIVTKSDPIAHLALVDAEDKEGLSPGGFVPFVGLTVKGTIGYTLSLNDGPPAPLSPPTLTNIHQSITIVGGNSPNIPFSFTVRYSLDVYNADGTYYKTITGQNTDTYSGPDDIVYSLQDSSTVIPTTASYTPGSYDNVGKLLFILKHNMLISTDSGAPILTPAPPYTYYVYAPY